MTKFFSALVAVLVLGVVGMSAQYSASESAQCSTTVVRGLSIEKNQDLDFGLQVQGAGEVTIATSSAQAVKFTIRGEDYFEVLLTYSAPGKLVNGNGNALPFTALVASSEKDDAANAKELVSNSTRNLNGDGYHYMYLGGTVDIAADQDRGLYTGQFDVNVEYTF